MQFPTTTTERQKRNIFPNLNKVNTKKKNQTREHMKDTQQSEGVGEGLDSPCLSLLVLTHAMNTKQSMISRDDFTNWLIPGAQLVLVHQKALAAVRLYAPEGLFKRD